MDCYFKTIDSPVGKIKLVASDKGLAAILWENDNPKRVRVKNLIEEINHPVLLDTELQLGEYFKGQRKTFSVTLDFSGTDFQKKVWEALLTIPYGETRTYGQIASQLKNPKAVRAVGAANGRNPISIIAPCHRVISASGSLTGFAGGLANKEILLNLENSGTGLKSSQKHYDLTDTNHQLPIFK
ncbi:MAG: methylated-DNA/protein-cysteine methyltransferase [Chitinophagaceae bacterium]|nr:methylated-DNA/protein-cysteine methyltransferase [Chitinophagaceae bacterium]